jgi:hypothetical protein
VPSLVPLGPSWLQGLREQEEPSYQLHLDPLRPSWEATEEDLRLVAYLGFPVACQVWEGALSDRRELLAEVVVALALLVVQRLALVALEKGEREQPRQDEGVAAWGQEQEQQRLEWEEVWQLDW